MLKMLIPLNGLSADSKFFIRANSGWNLATYYYAPKDKKKAHTIPILLIHGVMVNHHVFNLEKHSLVPYLKNNNFHVYSIDLRGCGDSYHDSQEFPDFNFDDMVSDVRFYYKWNTRTLPKTNFQSIRSYPSSFRTLFRWVINLYFYTYLSTKTKLHRIYYFISGFYRYDGYSS